VAFKAELVLQCPDDRLHPLPQPVREVPGFLLVFTGRPDQGQAQVVAAKEFLGLLSGQALVSDDGGAGRRAVSGLVLEHLPGLLAFAAELGIGQASSTCATARHTSSASVTSGGRPGPDLPKPEEGMIRSVSST
jgi:hypothetical protein